MGPTEISSGNGEKSHLTPSQLSHDGSENFFLFTKIEFFCKFYLRCFRIREAANQFSHEIFSSWSFSIRMWFHWNTKFYWRWWAKWTTTSERSCSKKFMFYFGVNCLWSEQKLIMWLKSEELSVTMFHFENHRKYRMLRRIMRFINFLSTFCAGLFVVCCYF